MSLRAKLAHSVYDYLDVGKSPRPADCIFVLAGKQERKTYGIKMWRFGYAAQLILSVHRSEWQQFRELNLESDGGLESQVNQAPPKNRHFFVRLDRQETVCATVQTGVFGTRSEARALARCLRDMPPLRSLLVVSSPAHMRRVELAFRRAFRRNRIQLTFVALPEKLSFDSGKARAEVWDEFRKYLFYRYFLIL